MCPVESPTGAEWPTPAAPAPRAGPTAAGLSHATACRLVGLAPSELAGWERAAGRDTGLRLPQRLAFANLVALAVLRELAGRVGPRIDDFAIGVADLFVALAARSDVERLDDYVALIGRDFARVVEGGNTRCVGDGLIEVPLRPILAAFRDQVFAWSRAGGAASAQPPHA